MFFSLSIFYFRLKIKTDYCYTYQHLFTNGFYYLFGLKMKPTISLNHLDMYSLVLLTLFQTLKNFLFTRLEFIFLDNDNIVSKLLDQYRLLTDM